jgi:hypothetical protein
MQQETKLDAGTFFQFRILGASRELPRETFDQSEAESFFRRQLRPIPSSAIETQASHGRSTRRTGGTFEGRPCASRRLSEPIRKADITLKPERRTGASGDFSPSARSIRGRNVRGASMSRRTAAYCGSNSPRQIASLRPLERRCNGYRNARSLLAAPPPRPAAQVRYGWPPNTCLLQAALAFQDAVDPGESVHDVC